LGEDDFILDGKGVPDSRRGTISNRAVGKSKTKQRTPGELAKRVIERRSGATSKSHSAGNTKDFEGGKRDFRAEYKAIED
jgi:ribose 1,5-bisphosphokinase PhnN